MDVFVYGTLRDEGVRNAVLGHEVAVMAAYKPDHSARRVKGEAYPMIKPMAGVNAPGMVLMGLSAGDIAQLDRFEGENYARVETSVILEDGRHYETHMYVEIAGRDEDGPFDLDEWLAGQREVFISGFMQKRGFERPDD